MNNINMSDGTGKSEEKKFTYISVIMIAMLNLFHPNHYILVQNNKFDSFKISRSLIFNYIIIAKYYLDIVVTKLQPKKYYSV
jgi:hypothetical protein